MNIIKEKRVEKNYSLQEIANILGYSRQAIHQLENGKYTPNCRTLIILSNILEIDLKNLVYFFAKFEKPNKKM